MDRLMDSMSEELREMRAEIITIQKEKTEKLNSNVVSFDSYRKRNVGT